MDISQLSTNAKGRGRQNSGKKNKEIIKREEIEGTPFTIVTANKKCFIGMGNYKLSEELDQEYKSELHRRINDKDWMLTAYTMNAMIDAHNRKENIQK